MKVSLLLPNPKLSSFLVQDQNYYGSFYKSKLAYSFGRLDYSLVRWAEKKFKRLKGSRRNATRWLKRIAAQEPNLFAHWQITYQPNG